MLLRFGFDGWGRILSYPLSLTKQCGGQTAIHVLSQDALIEQRLGEVNIVKMKLHSKHSASIQWTRTCEESDRDRTNLLGARRDRTHLMKNQTGTVQTYRRPERSNIDESRRVPLPIKLSGRGSKQITVAENRMALPADPTDYILYTWTWRSLTCDMPAENGSLYVLVTEYDLPRRAASFPHGCN